MRFRKIMLITTIILVLLSFSLFYFYNVSYRLKYREFITKYSEKYQIDEYLLMAMINTESRFNKDAVSPAGAVGLMQLTESTAEWIAHAMGQKNFNISDLHDPETNIKMGSWYFSNLREEFGSTELVLAAYNAGRGNVNKWLNDTAISKDGKSLDDIPFKETDNYVMKVMKDERIYKVLY